MNKIVEHCLMTSYRRDMNERECYDKIIEIVAKETGISRERILHCNSEDCVDARHILIGVMAQFGYTDKMLSAMTGLSRECCCISRNRLQLKMNKYFFQKSLHQCTKVCTRINEQ